MQLRAFFGDGNTNCPAAVGLGTRKGPAGEHTVKLAANSATIDRPTASDESGPKSVRSASEVERKLAASRTPAPSLRDLKTLNGERIVKMALAGTIGGTSKLVYITETGRKIPVG